MTMNNLIGLLDFECKPLIQFSNSQNNFRCESAISRRDGPEL